MKRAVPEIVGPVDFVVSLNFKTQRCWKKCSIAGPQIGPEIAHPKLLKWTPQKKAITRNGWPFMPCVILCHQGDSVGLIIWFPFSKFSKLIISFILRKVVFMVSSFWPFKIWFSLFVVLWNTRKKCFWLLAFGEMTLFVSRMMMMFILSCWVSEPSMAEFFTQMIRGGGTAYICTDWQRQVRMRRSSTCLAVNNNLYVWAMSQKLPYNGFRWMSQTELLLELMLAR